MYKSFEELRAEYGIVPLSQGDILDDCPLVFWKEPTREVTEGDKPQSLESRVMHTMPAAAIHDQPEAPVGADHPRCAIVPDPRQ